MPRVLVGNKLDSPNRVVTESGENQLFVDYKVQRLFVDAQTFASAQDIAYFETSAKDNVGVEEMFTEITRQALRQKVAQPVAGNRAGGDNLNLNAASSSQKKKSCCK